MGLSREKYNWLEKCISFATPLDCLGCGLRWMITCCHSLWNSHELFCILEPLFLQQEPDFPCLLPTFWGYFERKVCFPHEILKPCLSPDTYWSNELVLDIVKVQHYPCIYCWRMNFIWLKICICFLLYLAFNLLFWIKFEIKFNVKTLDHWREQILKNNNSS